jgi:hypothetical protein
MPIDFAIKFLDLLSGHCLDKFHFCTTELATKLVSSQLYIALKSHLSQHTALQNILVELADNREMPTARPWDST